MQSQSTKLKKFHKIDAKSFSNIYHPPKAPGVLWVWTEEKNDRADRLLISLDTVSILHIVKILLMGDTNLKFQATNSRHFLSRPDKDLKRERNFVGDFVTFFSESLFSNQITHWYCSTNQKQIQVSWSVVFCIRSKCFATN